MAEPTPSPVAETGAAARSASSSAASFMKARTFGMPRWVFLGLLAAGVGFGLWYRYRQGATTTDPSADPNAPVDPFSAAAADSLAANTDEPGLAGVGVAGVAPGQVVPVTTPTIPEGFPETVAGTQDLAASLAGGLIDLAGEFPSAAGPPNVTVKPKIVVRGRGQSGGKAKVNKKGSKKKQGAGKAHAATGGGPPTRPAAAHNPPKKKRK